MNLIDTIDKNTEHEDIAEKIVSGQIDFDELINSIMRGDTQIHGIDLQDMVNEALGSDILENLALDVVKFDATYRITMNFTSALSKVVAMEIEIALKNIITDYYPAWGIK